MHRVFPSLLGALVLAQVAPAQDRPGEILVSGIRTDGGTAGGLWVLDVGGSTPFRPVVGSQALSQNAACLLRHPVDPGLVYVGTHGRPPGGEVQPASVLRCKIVDGRLLEALPLNTNPVLEDRIVGLAAFGHELFYLGRYSLGAVSRGGGTARSILPLPATADPRGMVSDGRTLFAAWTAREIVRIDPNRPRFTPLCRIPGPADEEIQNLAIDNAGDLLVVTAIPNSRGHLYLFDQENGALLQRLTLPMVGGRAVAQDPDTGVITVLGAVAANRSAALTIEDWKVTSGPVGSLPNALPALVIQRDRTAFFTGHSCPGENGRHPLIGVYRRPRIGQSGSAVYVVGTPRRAAVLLAGVELAGYRPIDLSPFGAPGCRLGVVPTTFLFRRTDAVGLAAVAIPKPSALTLHGDIIRTQWVLEAIGVGALDLATSRVARLIVDN